MTGDLPGVTLLLDVASGAVVEGDVAAAWKRWRTVRRELDDATGAEVVVLPSAWGRAQTAGVRDVDAGRLDGLQRKARLTTAVTLSRVLAAQVALRSAGVASAVAGGASVVLLGAAPPAWRSVGGADLWVARSDFGRALSVLGVVASWRFGVAQRGWRGAARQTVTGSAAVPGSPGVVLRSRLPSLPPVDGRVVVATRRVVQWSGAEMEVLGPTEAVFGAAVLDSARGAVRAGRGLTAAQVGAELDRRLLQRLEDFDPERLRRLLAVSGWTSSR